MYLNINLEEMSKASEEIIKRKKVYENLSELKKQQQN